MLDLLNADGSRRPHHETTSPWKAVPSELVDHWRSDVGVRVRMSNGRVKRVQVPTRIQVSECGDSMSVGTYDLAGFHNGACVYKLPKTWKGCSMCVCVTTFQWVEPYWCMAQVRERSPERPSVRYVAPFTPGDLVPPSYGWKMKLPGAPVNPPPTIFHTLLPVSDGCAVEHVVTPEEAVARRFADAEKNGKIIDLL